MRLLLLIATLTLFSFANEKFFNMKSCETLQLSKLTALVSCHNIDYLIEYRNIDDEERDRIKKITAITVNDQRIIKAVGK